MASLEEQFGFLVRHHRKNADLTQAQLAELIDRQPGAVKNIENGKAGPTFETIVRLTKALHVEARDFFEVGNFSAREGRQDALLEIVNVLSVLPEAELVAMSDVIKSAMAFRRA
ncbi:helix-turn-helix transcriptional regulator [Caulobacter sp.]|uniref:helix-turn-helix domain-containing protein n=1 Tax=Caulobacter sp. TaxID=78 RepID=UPI0031D2FE2E